MKKLLLLLIFSSSILVLHAQYTDLINFTGTFGSYIGTAPAYSSLTPSGDTLYGMTFEGGINGVGTVFSVQTNGTNFNDLLDFTGTTGSYIGEYSLGSLTLSGDTLYGMTEEGGLNGIGNIFSVQTNGTNFKDLVDFTGSSGSFIGSHPYGSLTLSGDTLYGMTFVGGIYGLGNIFSVRTNGTNYKDLIDFTGSTGSYIGANPFASLALSSDTLYGMTVDGGINEDGNIFSVQTDGRNFKDLVDFTGYSGSYIGYGPYGSLTLSGDTLYGMTNIGGIDEIGNIFSVQTNGTNYKDLIDFSGTSGAYSGNGPFGSLTLSGYILYGMTPGGGINGTGNIFSVQTNGMNFKDLVNFTGTSGSYIGAGPLGSLTLSGDTLYGMTKLGGINGFGNIFSFKDTTVTTSVNPLSGGSGQLKVYPNPNNGIFTIQWSVYSGESSVMDIYNVLGEKVYTSTLSPPNGGGASFTYQMNLSSQLSGVYLYRVLNVDGGLVGDGKLIIQK